MHTPKPCPACLPEADARAGMTAFSVVPGGTVLRTTTSGQPRCDPMARPTASEADLTYERSTLPSTVGDGTEMRYASGSGPVRSSP